MLNIAMLDDDAAFLEGFRSIVQEYFQTQGIPAAVSVFSDCHAFLKELTQFDLIFMDIDMPEMSGIALAAKLRESDADTTLIFVSAHDSFVFESIQYMPFRFIRKKFVRRETEEAVAAFCRRYRASKQQLPLLLASGEERSVLLSQTAGFYAIRHDVFLLDGNGGSLPLMPRRYTMEQLETMLMEHGFLRVHKSYLINYRFIYQIRQDKILLQDASQQYMTIPLSRRRTLEVREAYHALLGEEES